MLVMKAESKDLKTEVYSEGGNTCTVCKYRKMDGEWVLMHRMEGFPAETIEYEYGVRL